MGRKKGERATGMVRAYKEFVEAVGQAASERRLTVADFCEQFLSAEVEKAHREYIHVESERLKRDE